MDMNVDERMELKQHRIGSILLFFWQIGHIIFLVFAAIALYSTSTYICGRCLTLSGSLVCAPMDACACVCTLGHVFFSRTNKRWSQSVNESTLQADNTSSAYSAHTFFTLLVLFSTNLFVYSWFKLIVQKKEALLKRRKQIHQLILRSFVCASNPIYLSIVR